MHKCRCYSPEEKTFILMHVTCWTKEKLAASIGRTPRGVRNFLQRRHEHARNQHLLTSGHAARLVGVSCQWLTKLARAGRIKARREPGGRWWLFALPALDEYFGERKR